MRIFASANKVEQVSTTTYITRIIALLPSLRTCSNLFAERKGATLLFVSQNFTRNGKQV